MGRGTTTRIIAPRPVLTLTGALTLVLVLLAFGAVMIDATAAAGWGQTPRARYGA